MSKLKKRTQQKENLEVCTKCFASKHIVFNFAYITYDKEFDDKARSTFYNRLLEVSTVPFVTLMTWHKSDLLSPLIEVGASRSIVPTD